MFWNLPQVPFQFNEPLIRPSRTLFTNCLCLIEQDKVVISRLVGQAGVPRISTTHLTASRPPSQVRPINCHLQVMSCVKLVPQITGCLHL